MMADLNQMPQHASYDMGLYCLLRSGSLDTWGICEFQVNIDNNIKVYTCGFNHLLTITKTRLFKYILKFLPIKNENFQIKNSDIFLISAQNLDCGYSLEPPRPGGSNEYPQSRF